MKCNSETKIAKQNCSYVQQWMFGCGIHSKEYTVDSHWSFISQ